MTTSPRAAMRAPMILVATYVVLSLAALVILVALLGMVVLINGREARTAFGAVSAPSSR